MRRQQAVNPEDGQQCAGSAVADRHCPEQGGIVVTRVLGRKAAPNRATRLAGPDFDDEDCWGADPNSTPMQ